MTFVEAAVQILRREGKPLHIKELTRLAIKHNLLSVVGRDPEAMMETRLLIEAKRPSADLVRVSPGIFGLRVYPPRGERGEAVKAEGEKVTKPKAEATATPAKDRADRGGKRRRSGRATDSPEATLAANPAEVVAPASTASPAATPSSDSPAPVQAIAPAPAEPAAKPAAAKSRRRTRDRATDRGPVPAPAATAPEGPAPVATPAPTVEPVTAPSPPTAPPVATSAVTPPPVTASILEPMAVPAVVPVPAPSAVSPVRSVVPPASHVTPAPATAAPSAKTPAPPQVDASKPTAPTAPPPAAPAVLASAPAAPERRPTEGTVEQKQESPRPERHPGHAHREDRPTGGHREERGSGHPREERSQPREERAPAPPREDRAAAPPREERPAASSSTPSPNHQGQSQPQQPRQMSLADAAYDVMRGASDGRALTHRQIAEIAVKRRLVRGELVDVSRAIRVALVREQRHRDTEGLRPRIRTLGPGQYALGERKLEPELYNAERELLDRASRTREATRVALRRRLRQLPPGAFELMMRLLLERMGMVGAEIVKRGEGVAYYGGNISRGGRSLKVLVAIRPGEGELSREAVAELRAGVRLRGFDEGLVLCAARAGGAALTELAAAPGIDLYDQDALTELLIRQHLGVRRMHLPVDYLDTELFNELLDQG